MEEIERNKSSLNGIVYDEYKLGGRTHRANGPAVLWENGAWWWWLHGKCHRYYGPTCDWNRFWYIHGEQIKW